MTTTTTMMMMMMMMMMMTRMMRDIFNTKRVGMPNFRYHTPFLDGVLQLLVSHLIGPSPSRFVGNLQYGSLQGVGVLVLRLVEVPVYVRVVIVVNCCHVCSRFGHLQLIDQFDEEVLHELEVVCSHAAGRVDHDADVQCLGTDWELRRGMFELKVSEYLRDMS